MNTNVINIIGGSGLGKSTLAAGVFYEMKMQGYDVELVTEYVKQWAWQGRKVTPLDAPLIFGHQSNLEANLYGKVDYIITDSPIMLNPVYEKFYKGYSIMEPAFWNFLKQANESGVVHHNFLLSRNKVFNPKGRYETEEQARQVDELVKTFLDDNKLPYVQLSCPDRERVDYVLHILKEYKENYGISFTSPKTEISTDAPIWEDLTIGV